jgi:virulence-associated protein VapD
MATGRKQIAFDLITANLKIYYPKEHWESSYDDIRNHMKANGFMWQQGSVYVSKMPMTSIQASKIIESLIDKCPWLNVCMRDCEITNIGRSHSQNHLFDKDADIPTRAELVNGL